MVPTLCDTVVEPAAIEFLLSIANSLDKTTDRHIVPSNRFSVSVRPAVDCRKQYESTDFEELDKLHIPSKCHGLLARGGLRLRFFGRKNFGDAEGHHDPAGTIVNIRFDIAIQTKPNCSAAELDSWSKPYRALLGISHVDSVDVVVGQLLQPVPVKPKSHVLPQFVGSRVVDEKSPSWLHARNSEPYEWIIVGGIPEVVKSRTELHLLALIGQCIVGIDHNEVIADIYRLLVAVLACGQFDVEYQSMDKNTAPNLLRCPLQSSADRQVSQSAHS